MDVLYEESAVDQNMHVNAKKYNALHYISIVAILIGCVFAFWTFLSIPTGNFSESDEAYNEQLAYCIMQLLVSLLFFSFWFVLTKWKARYNVSYDYLFVSGDLRISKVVGNRRHKLLANIDCQDILQIGDVENEDFTRLKADPNTKLVVCTSNQVPADDKFFMYVLASYDGKKLFVLECRETLLSHILKFTRHGVLERDYVSQEKKQ